MSFKIVQTLQASMVGDIREALKTIPEGDQKTVAYLGVIIGMASGLSFRSNKFDPSDPAVALTGVFEATPYDPNGETVQSAALFLPGGVQKTLVNTLKATLENPDPVGDQVLKPGQKIEAPLSATMPIRVEIGVSRSANKEGAGYQFHTTIVGEPEKVDALEALRNDVVSHGNERMKQIADRKAAHPALAAPKAVAPAAKPKAAKTGSRKR